VHISNLVAFRHFSEMLLYLPTSTIAWFQ